MPPSIATDLLMLLHPSHFFWYSSEDGYDETLVPLDYQSAGQIRDDDLFNTLVGPMRKGVTLTVSSGVYN